MYALIVTDCLGNVIGVHSSESVSELKRTYLPEGSYYNVSYRPNVLFTSTKSSEGPHNIIFTFIEIEE